MDKQLQRLIELSNKTGDRLIVFDPSNPDRAYVLMPLGDYERFAIGNSEVRGLTEDELLDKINRDIAIWKSDRIEEKLAENDEFGGGKRDVRFSMPDEDEYDGYFDDEEEEDDEDDDWYSLKEVTRKRHSGLPEAERGGGAWRIPNRRKKRAEEVIEEDRFYLEDVDD